jgi:hypothetical protein
MSAGLHQVDNGSATNPKGHIMTTSIARRIALTIAATSTILGGAAAASGSAFASQAPLAHAQHAAGQPLGWVTVQSCTSLVGSVTVNPGLRAKAHAETAVVTGTLDGCSSYGQAQPGQGSFTAVVSGNASKSTGTLSGTFTANWPVSSGLNPTNGTVTITTTSQGVYAVSGTVTSGAWTGSTLSTGYVVTGTQGTGTRRNPIVKQDFVNTAAFNLSRNGG